MTVTAGSTGLLALADELHVFCAAAPHDYPGHNITLFERAEQALRLAAKPADDGVRELQKRVKRYGSFCDPECEGRCRECPDDLIRDLAAALSTTGAPKP